MNADCVDIKKNLEQKYDLPFWVDYRKEYNDPVYIIAPENELEELFEVRLIFRQNIRLIIEVQPQKYAAGMLKDIQHAEVEKREVFLKYLDLFLEKNLKVEVYINQQSRNMYEQASWGGDWKTFKIRATRIMLGETEDNNIKFSVVEWAGITVGMMLALLNIESFNEEKKGFLEGGVQKALVNRYERDPANRELCLASNGYLCQICGFDFEKVYGKLGQYFIHVHHIEKVSTHENQYYLDPTTDLIPICPNCHAMLHRVDPPMNPEQLRYLMKEIEKEQEITDAKIGSNTD
ncbi:MAG: HNH endonuclease [Clostridium sp.]|nr:HNH endonuclease [Clostridium sp.]MCM1541868.1 HNH endonuclease [Blautia sp.]